MSGLNTSPAMKNWDLSALLMVFMGIGLSTGFDEDDVLELEPEADTFGHKVGADGEWVRFRNNNKVNKVSVHLMQTSIANSLFSAIATRDENTQGGAGVGPMLVQDLQGTTLLEAQNCFVSHRPTRTFGREPKPRVWELTCSIDVQIDGNN